MSKSIIEAITKLARPEYNANGGNKEKLAERKRRPANYRPKSKEENTVLPIEDTESTLLEFKISTSDSLNSIDRAIIEYTSTWQASKHYDKLREYTVIINNNSLTSEELQTKIQQLEQVEKDFQKILRQEEAESELEEDIKPGIIEGISFTYDNHKYIITTEDCFNKSQQKFDTRTIQGDIYCICLNCLNGNQPRQKLTINASIINYSIFEPKKHFLHFYGDFSFELFSYCGLVKYSDSDKKDKIFMYCVHRDERNWNIYGKYVYFKFDDERLNKYEDDFYSLSNTVCSLDLDRSKTDNLCSQNNFPKELYPTNFSDYIILNYQSHIYLSGWNCINKNLTNNLNLSKSKNSSIYFSDSRNCSCNHKDPKKRQKNSFLMKTRPSHKNENFKIMLKEAIISERLKSVYGLGTYLGSYYNKSTGSIVMTMEKFESSIAELIQDKFRKIKNLNDGIFIVHESLLIVVIVTVVDYLEALNLEGGSLLHHNQIQNDHILFKRDERGNSMQLCLVDFSQVGLNTDFDTDLDKDTDTCDFYDLGTSLLDFINLSPVNNIYEQKCPNLMFFISKCLMKKMTLNDALEDQSFLNWREQYDQHLIKSRAAIERIESQEVLAYARREEKGDVVDFYRFVYVK